MARRGTELRTDFTGDDARFQRTVTKQIGNAKKFGAAWETAGARAKRSVTVLSASVGGIIKGIVAVSAIRGLSNMGDEFDRLDKLSKRFGISVETLQGFGFAAKLAGSDMEELANGMVRMNKAAQDAATRGTAAQVDAFKALNINVEEFAKMRVEKQFLVIANAMQKATNKNRANAAVLDIMGRSAANLIPLLQQGAGQIEAQAASVGKVSRETSEAIAQMNDDFTQFATTMKTIVAPAFGILADAAKFLPFVWT